MSRPRRPTRSRLAAACCAALLFGFAVPVSSALGETPLETYQRTGQVPQCPSSVSVPNDVEQYAPDFLEALRDAQRNCHAAGGGAGAGAGATASTSPAQTNAAGAPVGPDGTPLPQGSAYVAKPPAPAKPFRNASAVSRHLPLAARGEARAPAPVLALAIMAILVVVGGAFAATMRRMGWGMNWVAVGDRVRSVIRRR